MLGAGAVKDTYELLRDGVTRILLLVDKKTQSKMSLSLKAYGKNDSGPKSTGTTEKSEESSSRSSSLM